MRDGNVNDLPIVQRADSLEELALRINSEFAVYRSNGWNRDAKD
jgi:hypothetical protein